MVDIFSLGFNDPSVIGWCKEQHFYTDLNGIFIAIIALGLFTLFWVWKFLCENHAPIVVSVGEERCERIANVLLLSGSLVLAGFLVWFFFFYKLEFMAHSI